MGEGAVCVCARMMEEAGENPTTSETDGDEGV